MKAGYEGGAGEDAPAGGAHPAPGTLRVRWSAESHVGRFRKLNEDACLVMTCSGEGFRIEETEGEASLDRADFVAAVSDGMGGANAGERASQMVVDEMSAIVPQTFRLAAAGLASDFASLLENACYTVHARINEQAGRSPECSGMGATLSLCWFTPDRIWFAHVGDSRIYRLRRGRLRQVSQDHTRVGHLVRAGLLNERQARSHPRRSVLQQALGAGIDRVTPQVGSLLYEPGERFLICSDGLVDGLWDKNITAMLGAPDAVAAVRETMLAKALEVSGRDNTSLVVVEVGEGARR